MPCCPRYNLVLVLNCIPVHFWSVLILGTKSWSWLAVLYLGLDNISLCILKSEPRLRQINPLTSKGRFQSHENLTLWTDPISLRRRLCAAEPTRSIHTLNGMHAIDFLTYSDEHPSRQSMVYVRVESGRDRARDLKIRGPTDHVPAILKWLRTVKGLNDIQQTHKCVHPSVACGRLLACLLGQLGSWWYRTTYIYFIVGETTTGLYSWHAENSSYSTSMLRRNNRTIRDVEAKKI